MNPNSDDLWWCADAWDDRLLDLLSLWSQDRSPYGGMSPDSVLGAFHDQAAQTNGGPGDYKAKASPPEGFFLKFCYKFPLLGYPKMRQNLNSPNPPPSFTPPEGLGRFEMWKWVGEVEEQARNSNYSIWAARSRHAILESGAEWTAEEAEQVAYLLAQSDSSIKADPTRPRREVIKEALEDDKRGITDAFKSFLSNPVLPQLEAPEGETEPLWNFLVSTLLGYVKVTTKKGHLLHLIVNNDKTDAELINHLRDSTYEKVFFNETSRAWWNTRLDAHPSQAVISPVWGGYYDLREDGGLATWNETQVLDWFKELETKEGEEDADFMEAVSWEMLHNPERENATRHVIRRALKTNNSSLLRFFIPAVPTVLKGLIVETMGGENDDVPLEWIMEVLSD